VRQESRAISREIIPTYVITVPEQTDRRTDDLLWHKRALT